MLGPKRRCFGFCYFDSKVLVFFDSEVLKYSLLCLVAWLMMNSEVLYDATCSEASTWSLTRRD